ncbi:hypothetical protein C1645_827684 [Glomus cerebriforme]|uniref:Uncharacterized protein n=1 Tax=Glomus cerebriforme TaxID=658196 RepID=A0A397SU96_9GLOM|nr:hypothetical protein C1645_827684 [Glomus cerebriforme]
MDNVFTNDNLNLHAKPMDSSTKNGMDAKREEQKEWRVYNKILLPYRRNNRIFNNPNGLPEPIILRLPKENSKEKNKKKLQEISETGGITLSAPRPNLSMNEYNGTQSQKATSNRRPLSSSSGSKWKCDSYMRKMGVQELLGDECLCQIGWHIKNDRKFHEFRGPTDEWLIDQENKEYFNKTYGITNIHSVFVDHSGMVILFLDDRGIIFEWSEMTQDMHILDYDN